MFHAVIAKKARIDNITDGATRHPREDLVTSALFGTVTFLTPPARQAALSTLIGHKLPADAKVILWPRLAPCAGTGGQRTEPDVVLEYPGKTGPEYWIVEVKWGAALGDDQIRREIDAVRDGDCPKGALPYPPRAVAGYTLLGREAKHSKMFEGARNSCGKSDTALEFQSISWPDLTERLRALTQAKDTDPGLKAWADATATFLSCTPQGAVLSKWPDLTVPPAVRFFFDDGTGCDAQ